MRSRSIALAVAATFAAVSSAAAQSSTKVTAWISSTVEPGSTQKVSFYVWNATAFEVSEYRIADASVAAALREGGVQLDTAGLTPTRKQSFTGQQGDMTVAAAPGIYVYVARPTAGANAQPQSQAVVVSKLALAVKRDDATSIGFLYASKSGATIPNANVQILQSNGPDAAATPILSGKTNARGLLSLATPTKGNLIYLASDGAQVAIQQTWDRAGWQPNPWMAHVETDRPLYRPGQSVGWRAIVRETLAPSRSYRTPVNEPVRAFLVDANGARTSLGAFTTSEFGTVSGTIRLSDVAKLGEWSVEIEAGPVSPNGPAPIGQAGFGVQEYRKPEFKVDVTPASKSFVQSTNAQATVKAVYYFGANVPGAKVHWTVTRSFRFRWWNPWLPVAYFRCMPPFWFRPPVVVAQGDAVTKSDGTAVVSYATGALADQDADDTIEARVTDASAREVAGSTTVPVVRAAFDLQLLSDRWVYQPGDRIEIKTSCAATDGTPAIGQTVRLVIEAVDTQGHKTKKIDRTLVSDVAGEAGLRLLAQNRGQYLITASAKDAQNHPISSTRTIWIQDQGGGVDWAWNQAEIVSDKDVYASGDTAVLLVKSPVKNGTGVLTLESNAIKTTVSFPIKLGLGIAALPIKADMSPNVFATVMIPTPTGLVTAQKELLVPAIDKLVDVTITADKAEYRPGDTAHLQVRAVDRQGHPVRAEIALAAVDEALYALRDDQTPKLTDTFFAKLWDGVTTSGAFGGGPIRFFAMAAHAAPTASAPAGGAKVREYFPDTLRWIATLRTDATGTAKLDQPIADSLTTWRLTALAVTSDTRVGQNTSSVLVRKDLVLRLEPPRTLVEGDELTLVGIVHNLAKPGTPGSTPSASVALDLQATGVTLLDGASRTATVPNGDLARVEWKVKVEAGAQAVLQASAHASFDQDALKVTLPVAARGVAAKDARAGALLKDGQTALTFAKDPKAIDPATELRIALSPSLASTMLDSLDYLTGYPYGCIEQTMSRFLPDVIVADTLKTLGKNDPDLQAKLPDMVQDGVDRIASMQGPDGGWGWFPGNGSQPYVSAYATYGLALAKKDGFAVPQDLLDRATKFLQTSLDAAPADQDVRAYMCFALATAGQFRTTDLHDLAAHKATLNDYSKAVVALALDLAGEKSIAKDVLGSLDQDAIAAPGRVHWEGKTSHYGAWQSSPTETTAYAILAHVQLDPQSPRIADAVAWLVERRQEDGQWTTTKDTAAVVFALSRYVLLTHELDPAFTATVTVNGQTQTIAFAAADLTKPARTITIPGASLGAQNQVTIARTGQGALYWSAVLDQKVRVDPIVAAESGIRVKRAFSVVTKTVDTNGNIVEHESPFTGTAKVGDTIRVKLQVQVTRPSDVEHVNIEDRFPTGFSVVEDMPRGWLGWSWWWSAREVHDDRVVFFATDLGLQGAAGGTTFDYTYDLRAETPGKFLALPTTAEAVYAPDTWGRSDAAVVVVDK